MINNCLLLTPLYYDPTHHISGVVVANLLARLLKKNYFNPDKPDRIKVFFLLLKYMLFKCIPVKFETKYLK